MRKLRNSLIVSIVYLMLVTLLPTFIFAATIEVDVTPYLTGSELEYNTDGSSTYQEVTEDTKNIPVDAHFRITGYYSKVPTENLKGNQLVYQLPDLFIDASVSDGSLLDSTGATIGTIRVNDGKVIMEFTDNHLRQDEITGDFVVYATANQSMTGENTTQTLNIGNKEYTLDFEKNADSRLGELNLEKTTPTLIEENGQGYLEYVLTVRTGDKPMKQVYVKDNITTHPEYVTEYIGVPNQGTGGDYKEALDALLLEDNETVEKPYEKIYTRVNNEDVDVDSDNGVNHDADTSNDVFHGNIHTQSKNNNSPGVMFWYVGNMGKNETRTLTYRVKLRDTNYYGRKKTDSVVNTATPYSMGYAHDNVRSTFTPRVDATVDKQSGTVVDVGQYIEIPYTIKVTANPANSWTMYGVKIPDNIGGNGGNVSKSAIVDLARYTDFHLYDNDGNEIALPTRSNGNPEVHYEHNQWNPRFDAFIGDLAKGETKVLTYKVRIDKSVLGTKNGEFNLGNSAGAYVTGKDEKDNNQVGQATAITSFGNKIWDRKLGSEKITSNVDQTVANTEQIFSLSNGKWILDNNAEKKVTIEEGSYKYQVVVNETGDWNVSSSTFKDSFNNNHLSYKGYLQVRYYENGIQQSSSDANAVAELEAIQPTKTVWLNVNDLHDFTFKPIDLGNFGQGAFLLTYYAATNDSETFTRTSVDNNFSLSGVATYGNGTGGASINIPGVEVKVTKVIDGNLHFEAQKYGWYYNNHAVQYFDHGQLFWVFDVTGNFIPKGEQFRDVPQGNNQSINNLAVIGVYQGKYGTGRDFADRAGNIGGISSMTGLKQLQLGTDYTWSRNDRISPVTGTITLAHDYRLDSDEHIYMVLRTVPMISWGQREQRTFSNKLDTASEGSTAFQTRNTASLSAIGGGTNFKEAASVLRKDSSGNWTTYVNGNWVTNASGNNQNKLVNRDKLDTGVYQDWRLKINFGGDLSGTVIVSDTIPQGLDLAYVRYFWINPSIYNDPPITEVIPELANNSEWQEIGLKNTHMDGTDGSKQPMSMIAYYNQSTRELRFKVGNLQNNGVMDGASLEVQVLTKATDTDVLIGGKSASYTNQMKVTNESGIELSTSSATSTFALPKSLDKTDSMIANRQIPFTIKANQQGLDLGNGADFITMIDELGNPLTYLPDTLKAVDNIGNNVNIKIAVEKTESGQKISFVIPNNLPVTITYSALVGVNHDVKFNESNKVYWNGYSTTTSEVNRKDQVYSVGGTSDPSGNPIFKIIKHDGLDADKKLSGAVFELRNAEENNGTWSVGDEVLFTGTTDDNGEITFDDNSLNYNHVYALVEIKSPNGYILDSRPVFLVVARAYNGEYQSNITELHNQGVIVQYGGKELTYDAYNNMGKIILNKLFKSTTGESIIPKQGTFKFAVYDDKQNKVQTLEAISDGNSVQYYRLLEDGREKIDQLEFNNLPINHTYRVFELDKNDDVVTGVDVIFRALNGTEYLETGSGVSVDLTDTSNITITNVELPVIIPTVIEENKNWVLAVYSGILAIIGIILVRGLRKIKS